MPASPSLAARAEAVLNQLAQVEAQEADRQARLEIENARQRASNSRQALKDALDAIPVLRSSACPYRRSPARPSPTCPWRGGPCGRRPRTSSGLC